MLSKKSVLPNFIRTIAIIAIASLSFTANAMHHEKDSKKAKAEHMQESGDKMKDKLSDKYKGDLDVDAVDLEESEDSMEAAIEGDQPE